MERKKGVLQRITNSIPGWKVPLPYFSSVHQKSAGNPTCKRHLIIFDSPGVFVVGIFHVFSVFHSRIATFDVFHRGDYGSAEGTKQEKYHERSICAGIRSHVKSIFQGDDVSVSLLFP